MIKSMIHARKVQARRALARRPGYAKAVVRYLRREHGNEYRSIMATLPVYFAPKLPDKKEKDDEHEERNKRFKIRGWLIASNLTRGSGSGAQQPKEASVIRHHNSTIERGVQA